MSEGIGNLWCVVGANGSGKSSICDTLSQHDEFETVKRDELLKSLWDEFEGYDQFAHTLRHGKRKEKQKVLKELRKKIRRLIQAFSSMLAITGHATQPDMAGFCEALKEKLRLNCKVDRVLFTG